MLMLIVWNGDGQLLLFTPIDMAQDDDKRALHDVIRHRLMKSKVFGLTSH